MTRLRKNGVEVCAKIVQISMAFYCRRGQSNAAASLSGPHCIQRLSLKERERSTVLML